MGTPTWKRELKRFAPALLLGPALFAFAGIAYALDVPESVAVVLVIAGWLVSGLAVVGLVAVLLRHVSRERCFAVAGVALGLFVVSVLMHNVIYVLFDVEEAVFFTLALVVSPALFLGGLIAAALPRHGIETPAHGKVRATWCLPSGPAGKLSLGLLAASGTGLFLFFGGIAAGQSGGDTFFSNPYLATTILLAGGAAVLAGLVAVWAVVREGDRSFGAFATIAFGTFVAFFAVAELGGHESPDSGSQGGPPNSHANLTATAVSVTEVLVSFDYSYHNDPRETRVTHMTVEALGTDRAALTGYPVTRIPETGVIERGDGHIDLTLTFTEDMFAQLAGFRVCFAAPDHPDLGCANASYKR